MKMYTNHNLPHGQHTIPTSLPSSHIRICSNIIPKLSRRADFPLEIRDDGDETTEDKLDQRHGHARAARRSDGDDIEDPINPLGEAEYPLPR